MQMTAEELADEEWGPVKDKKKGKKGKKKGNAADDDEAEAPKGQSDHAFVHDIPLITPSLS